MKIYCIVFCIVCSSFSVIAQSKGDIYTAEKSTIEAVTYFKEKKYTQAYSSLLKAENETKKVIDERLKSALPEKIDNWELQDENMMNALMILSSNSKIQTGLITTVTLYLEMVENKNDNTATLASTESSRITVTFSNNPNIKIAVDAIHKSDSDYAKNLKAGSITNPIKIKEFSGFSNYYDKMKLSEVSVVAGGGTIQIEGKGMESTDLLIKIANKIDYNKVIEIFGAQ